MLTEFIVRRGFGRNHVKEYFAVQRDGDIMSGVIAGPFESETQCYQAITALEPLYTRPIVCIGGHLVGWRDVTLK